MMAGTEDIPDITLRPADKADLENAHPDERHAFEYARDRLKGVYIGHGERPKAAVMFLDLAEFGSVAEYIARCRTVHKGNAVRDAIRAGRLGYYPAFFNSKNHLGDMLAIHESLPVRQGRRLPDDYFQTVEEQGGYPPSAYIDRPPRGALAWQRYFGLFLGKPGHKQGHLVLDKELIAYAHLRRYAETVFINRFIGNAAHLANGIMHKTHIDLVETLLKGRVLAGSDDAAPDRSMRGVRYLINGGYFGLLPDGYLGRTGGPGLLQWKLRMLYRPGFFICDSD